LASVLSASWSCVVILAPKTFSIGAPFWPSVST
jgi:hypothetical protein